jgi:hypothetical protein
MLGAVMLSVALQAGDLSFQQLEEYYWDCDTTFMKGELGGQDMMSCLAITEQFQTHFWDKFVFSQYWNAQKKAQWAKRGYKPDHEHDD